MKEFYGLKDKKFLQGIYKNIPVSVIALLIIFGLCLFGLYIIADMVFEDKNLWFDNAVFDRISPYINDRNTFFFKTITFFGSFAFLLSGNALLLMYFFAVKKERGNAWKVAGITISNMMVLFALKGLLQRERPPAPLLVQLHDYSFPSGHTISSVVFFGMLMYIIYQSCGNKYIKWITILFLLLLVLAVGISRVYLRYHYASDVIAGFLLGAIWLLLAHWILNKGFFRPAQE